MGLIFKIFKILCFFFRGLGQISTYDHESWAVGCISPTYQIMQRLSTFNVSISNGITNARPEKQFVHKILALTLFRVTVAYADIECLKSLRISLKHVKICL